MQWGGQGYTGSVCKGKDAMGVSGFVCVCVCVVGSVRMPFLYPCRSETVESWGMKWATHNITSHLNLSLSKIFPHHKNQTFSFLVSHNNSWGAFAKCRCPSCTQINKVKSSSGQEGRESLLETCQCFASFPACSLVQPACRASGQLASCT